MGEAKRRGEFEVRKQQGIVARAAAEIRLREERELRDKIMREQCTKRLEALMNSRRTQVPPGAFIIRKSERQSVPESAAAIILEANEKADTAVAELREQRRREAQMSAFVVVDAAIKNANATETAATQHKEGEET